jgi:hypothetical protein
MSSICLDFDGVIHNMTTPWAGPGDPPHDDPVPGVKGFINRLLKAGIKVYVFSCRSETEQGIRQMKDWFWYNDINPTDLFFPSTKPIADVYLEDRAMCFTGVFPKLADINNFKPWNK